MVEQCRDLRAVLKLLINVTQPDVAEALASGRGGVGPRVGGGGGGAKELDVAEVPLETGVGGRARALGCSGEKTGPLGVLAVAGRLCSCAKRQRLWPGCITAVPSQRSHSRAPQSRHAAARCPVAGCVPLP
jgi:hypothetical protein